MILQAMQDSLDVGFIEKAQNAGQLVVMGYILVVTAVVIVGVRAYREKPFTAQFWKVMATLIVLGLAAAAGLVDEGIEAAKGWIGK
jgi:amino acid permease